MTSLTQWDTDRSNHRSCSPPSSPSTRVQRSWSDGHFHLALSQLRSAVGGAPVRRCAPSSALSAMSSLSSVTTSRLACAAGSPPTVAYPTAISTTADDAEPPPLVCVLPLAARVMADASIAPPSLLAWLPSHHKLHSISVGVYDADQQLVRLAVVRGRVITHMGLHRAGVKYLFIEEALSAMPLIPLPLHSPCPSPSPSPYPTPHLAALCADALQVLDGAGRAGGVVRRCAADRAGGLRSAVVLRVAQGGSGERLHLTTGSPCPAASAALSCALHSFGQLHRLLACEAARIPHPSPRSVASAASASHSISNSRRIRHHFHVSCIAR